MGILDLAAYLDWAGLRPLTELEFEKMCRGFRAPVAGELAIGDITPVFAATLPTPMPGRAPATASA